jgi:hypothetical protein
MMNKSSFLADKGVCCEEVRDAMSLQIFGRRKTNPFHSEIDTNNRQAPKRYVFGWDEGVKDEI